MQWILKEDLLHARSSQETKQGIYQNCPASVNLQAGATVCMPFSCCKANVGSSTKVLYRVVPRMLDSEGYGRWSPLCSQERVNRWRCSSVCVCGGCVCVMAGGPTGCTSAFWPLSWRTNGLLIHCGLSSSSPSALRLRVLFLVLYLNALTLFPGLYAPFSQWYLLHLTLIVLSWTLMLPSKPTSNITFCELFQINKGIFFLCIHSYLQLSLV